MGSKPRTLQTALNPSLYRRRKKIRTMRNERGDARGEGDSGSEEALDRRDGLKRKSGVRYRVSGGKETEINHNEREE